VGVAFDSAEVHLEEFSDGELSTAGDIDELAYVVNEQVQSVGLELVIGERIPGWEFFLDETYCTTHLREGYPIPSTDGCENVGLHEIHKGEDGLTPVGKREDRLGDMLAVRTGVGASEGPVAQGTDGDPQVVGGFSDRISRQPARIAFD